MRERQTPAGVVCEAIGLLPHNKTAGRDAVVLYRTEAVSVPEANVGRAQPDLELAHAEVVDFLDKCVPTWRRTIAPDVPRLPWEWKQDTTTRALRPQAACPKLVRVRFPRAGLPAGRWWASDGDRVVVAVPDEFTGEMCPDGSVVPRRMAELLTVENCEVIKLAAGLQRAAWMAFGPGALWSFEVAPGITPGLPPLRIDCCVSSDAVNRMLRAACYRPPYARGIQLRAQAQATLARCLRHCATLPPVLGLPWM